ncbi:DUF5050 domain-containing protein [Marinilactibacillus kalidii]|uniref:DUF5050 domain-containing protein n=1 Tax=Marinilactibacillus kalidii TaxID=2820274 RepID=UPI001ABDDD8D|nr:DUF5050 domain-containing protein [Marinilactibacillus kalidii]
MKIVKNWIDIALRGTLLILVPGFLIVYVLYQFLFDVSLDVYWFVLFIVWVVYTKCLIDTYHVDSKCEIIQSFDGIEKLLVQENWELLDKSTTQLIVRPRFGFPYNLVLNDKVTVTYRSGQVRVEGPLEYINIFLKEIRGDEKVEQEKKWKSSSVVLSLLIFLLPILLDGSIWWEVKTFYHNASAGTTVQVEAVEPMTSGNLVENLHNGGFVVEDEEAVYYIEQGNRIVQTTKTFEEKETLMKEEGASYLNLNLVGNYLYLTDAGVLKRLSLTDGSLEVVYDFTYVDDIQIQGKWIYFSNYQDDFNLYRMDLNGGNLNRVFKGNIRGFSTYKDHVLVNYIERDHFKVSRMDNGEDSWRTVIEEEARDMTEKNGYYYYINENGQLYRKTVDNQAKPERIVEDYVHNYTITDENIYYSVYISSPDATNGVFKTELDGQHSTHIYEANTAVELGVVGSKILMKIEKEQSSDNIRIYDEMSKEVSGLE